jgi:predicted nucleic acid-binding protein
MSVLVDTSIWSMLFRRAGGSGAEVDRLRSLVRARQAAIIGVIRQELLSGVRSQQQFIRLRDSLRAFPDRSLNETHYERAAEFYNICRAQGVQGSNTDFLICAVADVDGLQIYSSDNDFTLFARHLPIQLLS